MSGKVVEMTPDLEAPRKRYELADDTGFDEVPKKYRKFYRRWNGPDDSLAPNEVICPVCKIVIRSNRELREGDRVYCMACMARMRIVKGEGGRLEAEVEY
ncbi:MAG: hypothetical protein HKP30_08175 [Myxococcales bacterium]|nr:hypothetical protein [Myxococcales bacterium]